MVNNSNKHAAGLRFFVFLAALFCTMMSFAQERVEKSYTLYYRVNKSDFDSTYMDNARILQTMRDDMHAILGEEGVRLDSLYIYALSSPEGPTALNNRLAGERAESARNLLSVQFPEIDPDNIMMGSRTNDWSGLLKTLRDDASIVHKDVLIRILEDPGIQDKTVALRAQRLAYAEVRDRILNYMRTATVTFVMTIEPKEEPKEEPKVEVPEVEPAEPAEEKEMPVVEPVQPIEKERRNFYMAAKSNMLYDLAVVPNIGLEFYLGKNFSIAGNWMYAWWKSDRIAWYWRTYGGDLAVRYWFGKAAKEKPLTGHHVGLYGQIVTYDFQTGGRGYLGDRWSYAGGIEYGYSLPIGRRLNIDFTLGFGYLGGEYKEYLPIDGHYVWQATKYRHLIGPTKAEISLVWLLGHGNINEKKGGRR